MNSVLQFLVNLKNTVQEKFREHPNSKSQSYTEHLFSALFYSICSLTCCVVFCIHAFFPFLFQCTGSQLLSHVKTMIDHYDDDKCSDGGESTADNDDNNQSSNEPMSLMQPDGSDDDSSTSE